MTFIVNATALLAGPETIVKANSLREAYEQGNATPELPDTPAPFSLENVEWSFMDAVESEAYLGNGEYELVPYASVDIYLDNGGKMFATEEEAENAVDEFISEYHPELELPIEWSQAGFELSEWDNVFIYEGGDGNAAFVPA